MQAMQTRRELADLSWKFDILDRNLPEDADVATLFEEIIHSQRVRWPSNEIPFEVNLVENEELISAWNLVLFGRNSVTNGPRKQFVQKEGSPEEKILKEAAAWRNYFSSQPQNLWDKRTNITVSEVSEFPREMALFRDAWIIRATSIEGCFIPKEIFEMKNLQMIEFASHKIQLK